MATIKNLSFGIAALVTVVVLGLGTYKVFKKDGKPESAPQTPPAVPQPKNNVTPNKIQPNTGTPNNNTPVAQNIPVKPHNVPPKRQETPSQPQNISSDSEESSENLDKVKNAFEEYLKKIYLEPLNIMTINNFRNKFPKFSPLAICANFLVGSETFHKLLHLNQFNSETQPFLRLFKDLAEEVKNPEIVNIAVNAEKKCLPRYFNDFNDIMDFIIRKISDEDERVRHIFYNELSIKSQDGVRNLGTNVTNTIDLSFARRDNLGKSENIEKICERSLFAKAMRKDQYKELSPRDICVETKHSDVIVITTNYFTQMMREKGMKHQQELFFRNEGPERIRYILKSIISETNSDSLDETKRFPTFEVKWLNIFDEETKNEWIRKLLTNAIFLLYERE
ncbi:hypothetical protein ENBRE01_1579 [Enteropsectra breve]|nr:hypothetical protein ENBRE01_1579 [Enteropsectra breve]